MNPIDSAYTSKPNRIGYGPIANADVCLYRTAHNPQMCVGTFRDTQYIDHTVRGSSNPQMISNGSSHVKVPSYPNGVYSYGVYTKCDDCPSQPPWIRR